MPIIFIIISVLLLISIVINVIQLRRQESYEDYIKELEQSNLDYYNFFKALKIRMSESNSKLRTIDRIGSFEADDEVGFIFKELRDIVDILHRSFE